MGHWKQILWLYKYVPTNIINILELRHLISIVKSINPHINSMFCIVEKLVTSDKKVCPRFTLDSVGKARELTEPVLGNYELLTITNNGRVVYERRPTIDNSMSFYFYSIKTDFGANNFWLVSEILKY